MSRPRVVQTRRIRRDLRRMGLGLFDVTVPSRSLRAITRFHTVVDKLIEDSQVEALRALREDRISLDELVDLDRAGGLASGRVLAAIQLRRPFFAAWDTVAPRLGRSPSSRRRYAVTRLALERRAGPILTPETRVADLADPERVDWAALQRAWGRSASDWMHVRRAVSRVLTLILGDKYHPFRRQVLMQIPILPEPRRRVQLSLDRLRAVLAETQEDVRPAFVALLATGMRVASEYLRCGPEHLLHEQRAVAVPGTKTAGSADLITVDPRFWPWVVAAIPAPRQYKALRLHWVEACRRAGVSGVVLHDLRHFHAQLATDQGIALRRVADSLRHASTAVTERYARSGNTLGVSSAVADAFFAGVLPAGPEGAHA